MAMQRTNRLLAKLPASEYERIRPHLEPVELKFKQVLYEAGQPVEYAYFFESGMASVIVHVGGDSIEVATIGDEGMLGLPILMAEPASTFRCFMQGAGRALRMPAHALERERDKDTPFRQLLFRYQNVFIAGVMQTGACNGIHQVHPRCCKWLLLCHDRMKMDELPLTHEFLSLMLGVRRASVSDALGPLQEAGLIRYTRGSVTIVDRKALEKSSCECYGEMTKWHSMLYDSNGDHR